MSKRSPAALCAAVIVLVAGSSVLAFQPERPAGQPGQPPQQGQPGEPGQPGGRGGRGGAGGAGGRAGMQIPVSQAMNTMNRATRQLKSQIGDATKRDENLRLVNAMQQGCVAAKGQPAPAEVLEQGADEAAKAAIADRYHRSLLSAMGMMLEVEEAILDGDAAAAGKKLDEITALRDVLHVEMGIEDE